MRPRWIPTPEALYTDPRYLAASLAARGLVAAFIPQGGRVPLVAGDPSRTARALGGAEGPAALDEVLDLGLVVLGDDAELILDVAWPEVGARETSTGSPSTPPPASSPSKRCKPSDTPERRLERQHRRRLNLQMERFGLRVGQFKDVPEGVTWEEWNTRNAPVTPPEGVTSRPPSRPVTPRHAPCHAPPVSPSHSPSFPREEGEERDNARERHAPVTPPCHAPAVTPRNAPIGVVTEGDLDRLVKASEGKVSLAASLRHRGVFLSLLTEMGATPELLDVMGELCRSPRAVWPWADRFKGRSGRVDLSFLLGGVKEGGHYEATALTQLVGAAFERLRADGSTPPDDTDPDNPFTGARNFTAERLERERQQRLAAGAPR